jgi:hypothetical protein
LEGGIEVTLVLGAESPGRVRDRHAVARRRPLRIVRRPERRQLGSIGSIRCGGRRVHRARPPAGATGVNGSAGRSSEPGTRRPADRPHVPHAGPRAMRPGTRSGGCDAPGKLNDAPAAPREGLRAWQRQPGTKVIPAARAPCSAARRPAPAVAPAPAADGVGKACGNGGDESKRWLWKMLSLPNEAELKPGTGTAATPCPLAQPLPPPPPPRPPSQTLPSCGRAVSQCGHHRSGHGSSAPAPRQDKHKKVRLARRRLALRACSGDPCGRAVQPHPPLGNECGRRGGRKGQPQGRGGPSPPSSSMAHP